MKSRRWKCPWAQSSFGLRPEDKGLIYEEIFQLVEHCGLRYDEAWNMPVNVRKWWMERKNKEIKERNKGIEKGNAPPPDAPFGNVFKK